MTPTPSPSKAASVSQGVPDGWTLAERREKALRDGYDEIAHHAHQIELIVKRGALAAFDAPVPEVPSLSAAVPASGGVEAVAWIDASSLPLKKDTREAHHATFVYASESDGFGGKRLPLMLIDRQRLREKIATEPDMHDTFKDVMADGVEAVARAIFSVGAGHDETWEELHSRSKMTYRAKASAAIAALSPAPTSGSEAGGEHMGRVEQDLRARIAELVTERDLLVSALTKPASEPADGGSHD